MRSAILRRFAREHRSNPRAAADRLQRDLRDAGGPLVEPIDGAPGSVLVTFVLLGNYAGPAVRCALFPGVEPSIPMGTVPGTTDVFWAEVTATDDVSTSYQFQRAVVELPDSAPLHDPDIMAGYVRDLYQVGLADPFNSDRCFPAAFSTEAAGSADPPADKWDCVLTLPGAQSFRWHDPTAQSGRVTRHRVDSTRLGNSRTVMVWTPPGHTVADGPYPVVIGLDGEGLLEQPFGADRIFDNLVAGGHVPPFVALLVANATGSSRMSEYPCNPEFPEFLADELLPQLRETYGLTDDPTGIAVGGFSYGGLASDWCGFRRPDVFGNVLSMSASLWWGNLPPGRHDPWLGRDDRPEWLTRQFSAGAARPVRFWVDVGTLENSAPPSAAGVDQVTASRNFRDVLVTKGYDVAGYLEQPGGHNSLNWRRTLPQGLIALFGGR